MSDGAHSEAHRLPMPALDLQNVSKIYAPRQRSWRDRLSGRGDPKADDAVVRTSISQPNSPAIGVDYRLEQTDAGWKVYDLNVEGIWLIQNYRNQFASEINRSGIDGLVSALNAKK